jgi:hypothetical protein
MKVLQRTLFVVTALVLFTQTVRHIYVRYLEPTGSVLDRYEPPVTADIKKANSLDELIRLYDEAYNKVKAAEAESKEQPKDPTVVSGHTEEEPYKSERLLREGIRDFESKSKEVFELRYFWFSGLVFLIIGVFCYKKGSPWLGLTLLIAAFSEMIWATSPSFRGGSQTEFDRLLTNKIIFSSISLVLLLAIGYAARRLETKRGATKGIIDQEA